MASVNRMVCRTIMLDSADDYRPFSVDDRAVRRYTVNISPNRINKPDTEPGPVTGTGWGVAV